MVEVFKTNVEFQEHAHMLVEQIHKVFPGYKANFDLDDCDNILRVVCASGSIHASLIINLLKHYGFTAQVLEDELPSDLLPLASEFSFDRLN
jgi:hypothetical protein